MGNREVSRLVVLFDGRCPFCVRVREWLESEEQLVPFAVVDAYSAEAKSWGTIPWMRRELVVVSDRGHVWAGPAAFILCFWALRRFRWLASFLAGPFVLPLAEMFFRALSTSRGRLGWAIGVPECEHGQCGVPSAAGPYR
jgi:predicted DCC family thiol-disulfide oxidoreductase YuxK